MNLLKSKIVLIGAGNVATHMGLAFREKGFTIEQIYSHTLESAQELGQKLNAGYTNDLHQLYTNADIYIFSIKDSVLPDILSTLPPLKGLLIHTAGSLPLSVFDHNQSQRYGVFYPLQTFNKGKKISFEGIPLFIEANNTEDEYLLEALGNLLSGKVIHLTSEKRQYLHLAAVFVCNFVNHLYVNAAEILEKEGLSREFLLPLIEETASKIKDLHPKEAQTGPAIRYDTNVINKHLELLKDEPERENLYKILSENINRIANPFSL